MKVKLKSDNNVKFQTLKLGTWYTVLDNNLKSNRYCLLNEYGNRHWYPADFFTVLGDDYECLTPEQVFECIRNRTPIEKCVNGKWLTVMHPEYENVVTIETVRYRKAKLTIDYFGYTIPAPINTETYMGDECYGVSVISNRVIKVRNFKVGHIYWATEDEAKAVLAIMTQPFNKTHLMEVPEV